MTNINLPKNLDGEPADDMLQTLISFGAVDAEEIYTMSEGEWNELDSFEEESWNS